jgi:hypothetical protein
MPGPATCRNSTAWQSVIAAGADLLALASVRADEGVPEGYVSP